jgi:hypothetical protein
MSTSKYPFQKMLNTNGVLEINTCISLSSKSHAVQFSLHLAQCTRATHWHHHTVRACRALHSYRNTETWLMSLNSCTTYNLKSFSTNHFNIENCRVCTCKYYTNVWQCALWNYNYTWMPPMVLILLLMMIAPPGTQYGIQQHSPVLVATLQTMQGKQKNPLKPVNWLIRIHCFCSPS